MMDGINNGWGMEFGWGWIIVIVAVILITWLVVKVVNRNNTKKP
jgi:hypothetical protein